MPWEDPSIRPISESADPRELKEMLETTVHQHYVRLRGLRASASTVRQCMATAIPLEKVEDGRDVIERLRDILAKHSVRLIDLFSQWDSNEDGLVSKEEFRKAMPLLGMSVQQDTVDALFASWDRDGDGHISLLEMHHILKHGGKVARNSALAVHGVQCLLAWQRQVENACNFPGMPHSPLPLVLLQGHRSP